jgi:hypothetical protein
MVEKKYQDYLKVSPTTASFSKVATGLRAWFDEKLLQKNLPATYGVTSADQKLADGFAKYIPESTVEALRDTEFINVFGRVVERDDSKGLLCLQYLYVWDFQAVPVHEGDYEPIFLFVGKDEPYAIYDLVHYCTRRLDLRSGGKEVPGLRVVPGWHSFLPSTLKATDIDAGLKVRPLSDEHLNSWWNIPDEEARFKVNGFLRDPFSLKAPGHFLDNPDEEARTMCCTFKEIEAAFRANSDPRVAIVDGLKRAFAQCIGIFALHRLGTFVRLLQEMSNVGMISVSPAMKTGLSLASIGAMLQEGFVSLTEKGRSFFEGFGKQ